MTMMKTHFLPAILLAAALLLISACGQKGPLYLPEDETGTTQSGESDQQKESEDEEDSSTSTE